MKSFVALDFETANQNHSSVCSVGLVFVEDKKIVDTFYELIKPLPNFYSYWNTKVHGLTDSDTQNAEDFAEIWIDLAKIIKTRPIVAHNSRFDESCLRAALKAYGLPTHTNEFHCTYLKSKKLFPELPNHKLPTVSSYLGYNLENHHDALADAQACAHIAIQVF